MLSLHSMNDISQSLVDVEQCIVFNKQLFYFLSLFQFNALPWSDILSSSAVWAIVIGHFGACWGYYTLFTGMPTYFKDVLHFDIEQVHMLFRVTKGNKTFYYINTKEIPGELSRDNMISSHVKITYYLIFFSC